ncbi:MAG: hypothetical protein WA733_10645, partial [Methylocystis sp.]
VATAAAFALPGFSSGVRAAPPQQANEHQQLSADQIAAFTDARVPDKPTLIEEVAVWQDNRNRRHVKADWKFTTDDARVKLKRLYPQFQ